MVECTNPDCGAPLGDSDVTRAGRCRYCGEMAVAPDSTPTRPETPLAFRAVTPIEELQCWVSQLEPEDVAALARKAKRMVEQKREEMDR